MGKVNLRLPDDLHTALREAAEADGRSVNNYLVRLVQATLNAGTPARDRVGGRR